MTILVRQASSMGEIFAAIADIRRAWNPTATNSEELWFRGQGQRCHKLEPGLNRSSIERFEYEEYSLMTTFKNWGASFAPRGIVSTWDWYFLAQHYRLPTRLLDWTESLLASVYFALEGRISQFSREDLDQLRAQPAVPPQYDDNSPTIWILDAGSLNNWAVGLDLTLTIDNEIVQPYCWDIFDKSDNKVSNPSEKPIAIVPPHQNPRIVAQRGMFTLHGTRNTPIDDLALNEDTAGLIQLGCIQLDHNNIAQLWNEVELAGTGRMSLFPDLDSVAEQVKWVYQSYTPREKLRED